MPISSSLQSEIEKSIGKIKQLVPMQGGDISPIYKISTSSTDFVIKVGTTAHDKQMLLSENQGLETLSQAGPVQCPKVYDFLEVNNESALLMQYIPSKPADTNTMKKLGRAMGELHSIEGKAFGFMNNNFIGSLPQDNTENSSWVDFYCDCRLSPQLSLAVENQYIRDSEVPTNECMKIQLSKYIPEVKASLLHGDFWSGNFLVGTDDSVYLIDPSVCYGHSEVDIAFSRLFSGFSLEFYSEYYKLKPEEKGFEERHQLYQLYYLLVHLNLFGNSYKHQVLQLLDKYFPPKKSLF